MGSTSDERVLAVSRVLLDESAFVSAWNVGRGLRQEEAVAEALEVADKRIGTDANGQSDHRGADPSGSSL
jgi:hypothetical protein